MTGITRMARTTALRGNQTVPCKPTSQETSRHLVRFNVDRQYVVIALTSSVLADAAATVARVYRSAAAVCCGHDRAAPTAVIALRVLAVLARVNGFGSPHRQGQTAQRHAGNPVGAGVCCVSAMTDDQRSDPSALVQRRERPGRARHERRRNHVPDRCPAPDAAHATPTCTTA